MTTDERRRHFRLRYPDAIRPVARRRGEDGVTVMAVTEISEGGLRLAGGQLPEVGVDVSLVIEFDDGAAIHVEGATVLRREADEVAVRFSALMPYTRVMTEQRRTIRYERYLSKGMLPPDVDFVLPGDPGAAQGRRAGT